MYKYLLALIFGLHCSNFLHAIDKTVIANGNWSNPASWSPVGVPASLDRVIIPTGKSLTVDASTTINKLTIDTAANLIWSGSHALILTGDLVVNGTLNMNGGDLSFSTPGLDFEIGPRGTFIWDPFTNTVAGATLFSRGVENFSSSSTLIIKKWYNYGIPLANSVNGHFGNIILNSLNPTGNIVEWNQNNTFSIHQVLGKLSIDQGWITLDKSANINSTSIGAIELMNVNSVFNGHNGTHSSGFTINTNEIKNMGGTFYGLADGNGNVSVNVNGNVTNLGNFKIINNSGVAAVGNGNAVFTVAGTFSQSFGDTRIIYNITTLNSGIFTASFNKIDLTGGIFFAQTAIHVNGGTSSFTVSDDIDINFNNTADKFRIASMSNIAGVINNMKLNFTVGGDINFNGPAAAEFTTSAAQGDELIQIGGNINIHNGAFNINYGNAIAAHQVQLTIQGNLTLVAGSIFLSRNAGTLNTLIQGNVLLQGGNLVVKADAGAANCLVHGDYLQTAGTLALHRNATIINPMPIQWIIEGNFTQSNGIINYEDNLLSGNAENAIILKGEEVNLNGNGIIFKAGAGTSATFGKLLFARNGSMQYKRPSPNHSVSQIKLIVESNCQLQAQNNIQIPSHATSLNPLLTVNPGGILKILNFSVFSNAAFPFSKILIDSAAMVQTTHANGLYNNTATASFSNGGNLRFALHPLSIVEYCSRNAQQLTGYGYGSAIVSECKYGILSINSASVSLTNNVSLGQNSVVRTLLLLKRGILNLNDYKLIIESGSPSAITRVNGGILSEGNDAFNENIVSWLQTSQGEYIFPFVKANATYIPVTFEVINGSGTINISTRATANPNNEPLPNTVPGTATANPATQVYFDPANASLPTTEMIDRWWHVDAQGLSGNVTLTYDGDENTIDPGYRNGLISMVQWQAGNWANHGGISQAVTSGTATVTANGISGFGILALRKADNSTPVDLLYYDVLLKVNEVYINWATQSEFNCQYFTVQRSVDGTNFQNLIRMSGAGTSTHTNTYASIDKNPSVGTNYYRLMFTDASGINTYSEVKTIEYSESVSDDPVIEQIGPNPFSNSFKTGFTLSSDGEVQITLTSSNGAVVHQETIAASKGHQFYEFNDQYSLPNGIYYFSITKNDKRTTKKLIKK